MQHHQSTGLKRVRVGFSALEAEQVVGLSNRLSMKIVIQHAAKELYLRSPDEWVKDETHARVFKSSLEAIDFCMAHNIKQVFIVLKFDDPQYDIQLRPFPEKH